MIELTKQDDVYVLTMKDGENRLNAGWLKGISDALDEVEAGEDPKAMVTTGTGKFYSNGLDLDWLKGADVDMPAFVAECERIFARILGAPYVTVAAINGHAFAAGAMLAMAHDYSVMRADRGYICLPEVDIKIPLAPGMSELITSRLNHFTAHEMLVTGRRFGGVEATSHQIVNKAATAAEVVPTSVTWAQRLAEKSSPTLGMIKQRLYGKAIELLSNSPGTEFPSGVSD